MITTLYDKYFQKSKVFLFPLLELPKSSLIASVQTYIAWENNIRQEDCKLICVFSDITSTYFEAYEENYINLSPLLLTKHDGKDNKRVCIFDLSDFSIDIKHFLKGKYSYLSDNAKMLIKRYYGSTSTEFAYVDTFINPKEYTKIYSELLGVTEETLRQVGELCDPYDINKEFLKFTPVNLEVVPI
jgi:hypothetical protein